MIKESMVNPNEEQSDERAKWEAGVKRIQQLKREIAKKLEELYGEDGLDEYNKIQRQAFNAFLNVAPRAELEKYATIHLLIDGSVFSDDCKDLIFDFDGYLSIEKFFEEKLKEINERLDKLKQSK